MHLNAGRLPARTDGDGGLLLLAEQDRSRWDPAGIKRGLRHLAASGTGLTATRYHLEAGIAACHSLAPSFAETDWKQIVTLYDLLLEQDGSPIVALNRAVAVAQASGHHAGLAALDQIKNRAALENYYHLHSVTGQLWLDAGDKAKAAASFRRALELAALPAERVLLERRLAQCEG
jgi:RNA polymerase sigma-70 factor (ECF subfamily)